MELSKEDIISSVKFFYDQIYNFLDQLKGNDAEKYEKAYFKMIDGRTLEVAFDKSNVFINNAQFDDEANPLKGDCFTIMQDSAFGFFINITIYGEDGSRFDFRVADEENPYDKKISEPDLKIVKEYLDNLYESCWYVEYDEKRVQNPENYNAKTIAELTNDIDVEKYYDNTTMNYDMKKILKKIS